MLELSSEYPETVFRLHGDGEEAGDVWDKYYTGGKLIHTEKFKDLPKPDMKDW